MEYFRTKYQCNGVFKVADTMYKQDITQLNSLELFLSSGYSWLASRYIYSDANNSDFYLRRVKFDGIVGDAYSDTTNQPLCGVSPSLGGTANGSSSAGFRPIFLLTPNIKITKGIGTSDNPYILADI